MTHPRHPAHGQLSVRIIPTPAEDVVGRAMAALLAARGGSAYLAPSEISSAPDSVALAIDPSGAWTLSAMPDPEATSTHAVVRFDTLKVARLSSWTAEVFGDEFVITGRMSPVALLWPPVGDDVPIRRLELPGRGVLEDITARVTISNHRRDILLTVGFPLPSGFLDAS